MGTLSYLKSSDNKVGDTLTPDSEDVNFPVENFQTLPISKPYKSSVLVSSPATVVKILMDFGSAQTFDTFALVDHNLQSSATIVFRGGAAPDPAGVVSTVTWRAGLAWDVIDPSVSHRYWSLTIDDASNPDGYIRIGYRIMGLKTDLVVNQFHEWSKPRVKKVREVLNEIGVPMLGAKIYEGTRVIMSFRGLTNSELTAVDAWLDSLDLKVDPLLLIPELTETDAFFCRMEEPHTVEEHDGLNFIEGVPFITDHLGKFIV